MTHICVGNLTIIGRRQAMIWTNAGILLIGPWGTNFSEILSEIHIFSFNKMHLKNVVWKMAAILSRPQCVNSLMSWVRTLQFGDRTVAFIIAIWMRLLKRRSDSPASFACTGIQEWSWWKYEKKKMKLRGKWIKSISIARSSSQFPVWSQLPETTKPQLYALMTSIGKVPQVKWLFGAFFTWQWRLLHPGMRCCFGDYSYSPLPVRSKGRLVSRMYVFSMYFRY